MGCHGVVSYTCYLLSSEEKKGFLPTFSHSQRHNACFFAFAKLAHFISFSQKQTKKFCGEGTRCHRHSPKKFPELHHLENQDRGIQNPQGSSKRKKHWNTLKDDIYTWFEFVKNVLL